MDFQTDTSSIRLILENGGRTGGEKKMGKIPIT